MARAALGVLQQMQRLDHVTPDEVSYGTAVAACERSRQWRAALSLLEEACAVQLADVRAFNSAISAVARGAGWWSALKVLRTMEAARFRPRRPPGRGRRRGRAKPSGFRVHPDARSYGPILMAASRAHMWRQALELIDDEMAPRGIALDSYAGSAVITSLARSSGRQWCKALELLRRIHSPNVACFTAAAGVCGRLGGYGRLALLDELEERGVQPDARCLQTIAWAAGRGEGWSAALATLRRMRSEGHVVDAADFLGVALAVCEGEVATFTLLNAARDEGVDVDPLSFYSAVVQGWQGQTGQTPAEASVSVLRGLASGQLFLTSDLRAWNLLCEAATDASEPSEEVEAEEDDEQGEGDADARDNGGEAAAPDALSQAEVGAGQGLSEDVLTLVDKAYTRAVDEGVLDPWLAPPDGDAPHSAVDLHGYSAVLARSAVRHVLARLQAEAPLRDGDAASPRKPLALDADGSFTIITGRGLGSTDAAVLGPVVRAYLAGLSPPVTAHTVDGNDGRLRVDPESLQRWLSAKEHE